MNGKNIKKKIKDSEKIELGVVLIEKNTTEFIFKGKVVNESNATVSKAKVQIILNK